MMPPSWEGRAVRSALYLDPVACELGDRIDAETCDGVATGEDR